jgi:hypothetical protein
MFEEARGLHEENDSVFVLVYLSRCTKGNKYCLYLLNSLRTFQKVRVYSHYLLCYQRQENCNIKIVCGTWTTMWHQRSWRGEHKPYCVFYRTALRHQLIWICPDEGSSWILRNVGALLPGNAMPRPRRHHSSRTALWRTVKDQRCL